MVIKVRTNNFYMIRCLHFFPHTIMPMHESLLHIGEPLRSIGLITHLISLFVCMFVVCYMYGSAIKCTYMFYSYLMRSNYNVKILQNEELANYVILKLTNL